MDKPIDYNVMRVKLEFLYRMLNYNMVYARGKGYSQSGAEEINNIVATVGLNLIWIQRADPAAIVTRHASIAAVGPCQVIADKLIKLAESVREKWDTTLPIKARVERYEEQIKSGIDEIIETIRGLVEGKEAAHGQG